MDSWSEWRRPAPTAAEQRRDVWLALAVTAGGLVMIVLVNSMGAFVQGKAPSLAEQLVWGVLVTAPLVVRRRYPVVVLLVIGVFFIAAQWRQVGDNFTQSVALFLAIYTVGAWEQHRMRSRWTRIGVIVTMFCWLGFNLVRSLLGPPGTFEDARGPLDPVLASVLYGIGFNLLFFLFAYYVGDLAWLSARRQAEIEHRAEELRLSQEENTRGAIIAERVRIARDLHDVIAHHVAVMGIQAAAARRVFDTDPETAKEALQLVEQTARSSVGEMRGLLGVLRTSEEEPSGPAPGLDQLPELVENARSTGLDVDHGTFGEPRPVPDSVALSAYRVVQEALTNVVKHADASKVDVRVRYLDAALEVEISDDGRGHSSRDAGGFGLVGMRERVAVHGGAFEAGPRRGAGYLVRASLPTEEAR